MATSMTSRLQNTLGGLAAHALFAAISITPCAVGATIVGPSGTGLAAPGTVIDFGAGLFPQGTVITNQFAGQGVTFGNATGLPYKYHSDINGDRLGSQAVVVSNQPDSIFFTSPVTEAAFNFLANFGTTTFSALLGGVLQDQATLNVQFPGQFYSFTGIQFDEIQIQINIANKNFEIDDLQFTVADSDGDGVNDDDDLCPDTAPGDVVNADGCSAAQVIANVIADTEGVLADIEALIAALVEPLTKEQKKQKKKLEKARDKLIDALDEFAQGDVKKGFKKIADAVDELLKAKDEGADVDAIINQLVELARATAQDAIDRAQARCDAEPDPDLKADCQKEVDKANDEMAKAQEELDVKGHPDHAVDHYAKAWDHANKA